jgi:acyl carrier protein
MIAATLNRPGIIAELRAILNRVTNGRVKADEVREDAGIFDNLGLSSLELLELRFEVETTWNVLIEDKDVVELQVVSDVIDMIGARAAA